MTKDNVSSEMYQYYSIMSKTDNLKGNSDDVKGIVEKLDDLAFRELCK